MMDGIKQKLSALRIEESDLSEKLSILDSEIRTAKEQNDSLQYEIQSLVSSEKLLKLKIESEKSRLSNIEHKLLKHEQLRSTSDGEIRQSEPGESTEEELESDLAKKREEVCSIGAQYEEIMIHMQQVEREKKRKEARLAALEKDVLMLESQHSEIKVAWNKVESVNSPGQINNEDDPIEQLELEVKEVQNRLDLANTQLEHSQREITRLNRLIAGCKDDLAEERRANERLKKEFDGLCSELESI